jgi:hypothetical protein
MLCPSQRNVATLYFAPDARDSVRVVLPNTVHGASRAQAIERGRVLVSRCCWEKCRKQTLALYCERN